MKTIYITKETQRKLFREMDRKGTKHTTKVLVEAGHGEELMDFFLSREPEFRIQTI